MNFDHTDFCKRMTKCFEVALSTDTTTLQDIIDDMKGVLNTEIGLQRLREVSVLKVQYERANQLGLFFDIEGKLYQ